MELSPELVTELSRLVEVDSFESPEALVKSITDEIHSLRSDNVKFLDERDAAVEKLSAAQIVKIEPNECKAEEPEEIYLSRLEAREERIDRMVASGDMPGFIGERYKKEIREHAKPGAIFLSRDAKTNKIAIDPFIAMFEGSKLGVVQRQRSLTNTQTTNLSRENPPDVPSDTDSANKATGVNPYEPEIQRVTAAK